MTVTPRPRPRWATVSTVAVVLAVGGVAAAVGAWIDWVHWNPVYGYQVLAIVVAIMVAIVGSIVAFALRRRGPVARLIWFTSLAVPVGLYLGMALGPSRPALLYDDGTYVLRLVRPAPLEVSGIASCSISEDGAQFSLSGSSDQLPTEGAPFVSVSVASGDMFQREAPSRPDHLVVGVVVSDAGPYADDEGVREASLTSDASSELAFERDGATGSMTFDGLADRTPAGQVHPRAISTDLAGTIEWDCGDGATAG